VGTTINRGEDLAVKGAVGFFLIDTLVLTAYNVNLQTYIFEVVEVVPDPNSRSKRWYKLRLDCRDDAKGPVTAVCGMNGYLVSSMGQKVWCSGLVNPISSSNIGPPRSLSGHSTRMSV